MHGENVEVGQGPFRIDASSSRVGTRQSPSARPSLRILRMSLIHDAVFPVHAEGRASPVASHHEYALSELLSPPGTCFSQIRFHCVSRTASPRSTKRAPASTVNGT